MTRRQYAPIPLQVLSPVPFSSAEEAWFWFVQAQQARQEGARISAGKGLLPRPCEPLDLLRIVDRLYRQRRLLREHLAVLAHYGRRMMAPDPNRFREQRADLLWREALDLIGGALRAKGIVADAAAVPAGLPYGAAGAGVAA